MHPPRGEKGYCSEECKAILAHYTITWLGALPKTINPKEKYDLFMCFSFFKCFTGGGQCDYNFTK